MGREVCGAYSNSKVCDVKIISTSIDNVFIIEIEKLIDERGFFARSHCIETMKEFGLNGLVRQESYSYNEKKGTLRGLHYQVTPYEVVFRRNF